MPDSKIDFSDIPQRNDAWFENALLVPAVASNGSQSWHDRVEEAMRNHKKKAVSLRLDRTVYDWFKAQGPRYQSRINAVLKAYMDAHRG